MADYTSKYKGDQIDEAVGKALNGGAGSVSSVNGQTGDVQIDIPNVPSWAMQSSKPTYTAAEVGALPSSYTPPNQTASQVGADPAGSANTAVSAHNTDGSAHNDIRALIESLTQKLNALADCDDATLDQMSEVVAYIKNNKSIIDGIATSKVNVTDIINNLTTNVTNKPLSAAQGVAIKKLIDAIVVPTKVSALENDTGYLDSSALSGAISAALVQAKESGEFKGDPGEDGPKGDKGDTGATGHRGTGILKTTTAPSSYTTETGGFTPTYRIALSTVMSESGVSEVLVGDQIRYSYYLYPVGYVSSSYVYLGARVSIRGSTGAAGKTPVKGTDYWTDEDKAEIEGYVDDTIDSFGLAVSVKSLGAKGDGSTDDTAVFQTALANNRRVFVPGGSYKLSEELIIGNNCQLELAQDAVLYFEQTTGNCISMKMSANIVGNHATVSVPYTFNGNVINIDTGLNDSVTDVPPFVKWDPMWKTARFIADLNIVKPDTRGFYYSMDGTCTGVAVYIHADYTDTSTFIWAADLSKLRIAGAFKYGIFAEGYKENKVDSAGWIHQLRLDGFIDGSEVGLYLKTVEHAYASVLVLPRRAYTTDGQYIPYAKWGICLENSRNTNLLGSRVMDWNSTYSLWEAGNIYQHIALIGNCQDVKLDDFLYYAAPSHDIRDLIYTDTPSNLDSVSILEEPITRWFRPIDGAPYFNDGYAVKRLLLKDELDECFQVDRVPDFTNVLPQAIDTDGSVYNGIGYVKSGYYINSSGGVTAGEYNGCTGFIPVKQGDVLYVENLQISNASNGYVAVCSYDSSFAYMAHRTGVDVATEDYFFKYDALDNGFKLTIKNRSTVAYVRLAYLRGDIGENPVISINTPITYSQYGFLADGIKVKAENLTGMDGYEEKKRLVTAISSSSTDAQYPSAKAVYTALQDAIGDAIGGSY